MENQILLVATMIGGNVGNNRHNRASFPTCPALYRDPNTEVGVTRARRNSRFPHFAGDEGGAQSVSSNRFLGPCISSQRQPGGTQTSRLCENGDPVYFTIFEGLLSLARATELHLSGHRLSRLPIAFGLHCVNCRLMDRTLRIIPHGCALGGYNHIAQAPGDYRGSDAGNLRTPI